MPKEWQPLIPCFCFHREGSGLIGSRTCWLIFLVAQGICQTLLHISNESNFFLLSFFICGFHPLYSIIRPTMVWVILALVSSKTSLRLMIFGNSTSFALRIHHCLLTLYSSWDILFCNHSWSTDVYSSTKGYPSVSSFPLWNLRKGSDADLPNLCMVGCLLFCWQHWIKRQSLH